MNNFEKNVDKKGGTSIIRKKFIYFTLDILFMFVLIVPPA